MSIKLLLRKSDLQGALLFKRSARRIEMTFNSPDVRNGAICLSGSTALEESSALRLNVVETGLSGHLTPSRRLRERERKESMLRSLVLSRFPSLTAQRVPAAKD